MGNIPEEIKQKIETENNLRSSEMAIEEAFSFSEGFDSGAEFCYSLVEKELAEYAESMVQICKEKNRYKRELEEKTKEIERLKGMLKEQQFGIDFIMWYSGMNEDSVRQGYSQYLQTDDNNL